VAVPDGERSWSSSVAPILGEFVGEAENKKWQTRRRPIQNVA
jgi:hypothetical protein